MLRSKSISVMLAICTTIVAACLRLRRQLFTYPLLWEPLGKGVGFRYLVASFWDLDLVCPKQCKSTTLEAISLAVRGEISLEQLSL